MLQKKQLTNNGLITIYLVFLLCFQFFVDIFHLPSFISFLTDGINVVLLLIMLREGRIKLKKRLAFPLLAYVGYAVANGCLQTENPLLLVWAGRNNFRYLIFFIFCTQFLTLESFKKNMRVLEIAVYINLFVCLIQFFAFGIRYDQLGGIFGIQNGCNGDMNILLTIVASYKCTQYMNGDSDFKKIVLALGACCVIAALAEMKAFYVELIVIVAISVVLSKNVVRKIKILSLAACGVVFIAIVVSYIYPVFAGTFNLEGLLRILTNEKGYTMSGDLNRLIALSQIHERLPNFPFLFGLGFGNCELSMGISFFNSSFVQRYFDWHYTWISYAWMYLELGIVGLLLYELLFVQIAVDLLRKKGKGIREKSLRDFGIIISVVAIIITVYNSSLRTESGYLMYFALSVANIFPQKRFSAQRSEKLK